MAEAQLSTMMAALKNLKNVQELRLLFCQQSPSSAGIRYHQVFGTLWSYNLLVQQGVCEHKLPRDQDGQPEVPVACARGHRR